MHDADDSLFRAYGLGGSPAAVLIDADGRISSRPVMGAPEVTELLGGGDAQPELTVRSYS